MVDVCLKYKLFVSSDKSNIINERRHTDRHTDRQVINVAKNIKYMVRRDSFTLFKGIVTEIA